MQPQLSIVITSLCMHDASCNLCTFINSWNYFMTFATDEAFYLQLYKEMCNQSEAVVKWLYMQSKV